MELARENAHFRDRIRILPPAAVGGQQVLVVGLGRDALDASAVLDDGSALRRNAGELAQLIDPNPVSRKPLNDRQGTLRARAAAVEQQRTLLVSLSLTFAQPLDAQLQLISQLHPDQLWVAVAVSRKAEDTAQWVLSCGGAPCLRCARVERRTDVLGPIGHRAGLPGALGRALTSSRGTPVCLVGAGTHSKSRRTGPDR